MAHRATGKVAELRGHDGEAATWRDNVGRWRRRPARSWQCLCQADDGRRAAMGIKAILATMSSSIIARAERRAADDRRSRVDVRSVAHRSASRRRLSISRSGLSSSRGKVVAHAAWRDMRLQSAGVDSIFARKDD